MKKHLFCRILLSAALILSLHACALAAPWFSAGYTDTATGEAKVSGDWNASVSVKETGIEIYEVVAQWKPGVIFGNTIGVKVNNNVTLAGGRAPASMTVVDSAGLIIVDPVEIVSDDTSFTFTFLVVSSGIDSKKFKMSGLILFSDSSSIPFDIEWGKHGLGGKFRLYPTAAKK